MMTKIEPPEWSIGFMLYNEARTIAEVLTRTCQTMDSLGVSYEIVVVDDGSQDESAAIIEKAALSNKHIRLIRHETNLGIGLTLRDCWESLQGKICGVLCSDLQFNPRDLKRIHQVFNQTDKKVELVQVLRGGSRYDAWHRKYFSRLDETLISFLFGVNFIDMHWVKFLRRELLDQMSFVSKSPFLDTEMLLLASWQKASIVALPLKHYPRRHGQSHGLNPRHVVTTLKDLLFFAVRHFKHILSHFLSSLRSIAARSKRIA